MNGHHSGHMNKQGMRNYMIFGVNLLLGLVIMYLAMFTMIDGVSDFRNNLNMFYMALTMLAPMGIIMLATMGEMYPWRGINVAIYAGLVVLCVTSLVATRRQWLVEDQQFIASMIPHHSGAILMCRESRLKDQELARLCERITQSQRDEIMQMNAIAGRLETGREAP
jgi:hypothetical protein